SELYGFIRDTLEQGFGHVGYTARTYGMEWENPRGDRIRIDDLDAEALRNGGIRARVDALIVPSASTVAGEGGVEEASRKVLEETLMVGGPSLSSPNPMSAHKLVRWAPTIARYAAVREPWARRSA
ncbi:unnamed protein product, partial [marine sediment metagenome]